MDQHEVDQHTPHPVMSITQLRAQPVVWKARISASHALTVRASLDSSATPTPSDQR